MGRRQAEGQGAGQDKPEWECIYSINIVEYPPGAKHRRGLATRRLVNKVK